MVPRSSWGHLLQELGVLFDKNKNKCIQLYSGNFYEYLYVAHMSIV